MIRCVFFYCQDYRAVFSPGARTFATLTCYRQNKRSQKCHFETAWRESDLKYRPKRSAFRGYEMPMQIVGVAGSGGGEFETKFELGACALGWPAAKRKQEDGGGSGILRLATSMDRKPCFLPI